MKPEPIANGVWSLDGWIRVIPGFHLPLRTVVLRLYDGGLALHSPQAIDDDTAAALDELGPVRTIIAPNSMHHLFVGAAAARYPDASILASEALKSKMKLDRPADDVSWMGAFTAPELADDFDSLRVEGAPKLSEHVFFHRASATLVVTDVLFNLSATRGFLSPLLLRMVGTHRRLAVSKLVKNLVEDRAAVAASMQKMLRWPFERVAMAHGEVLEGEGVRQRTREALEWMLAGDPATRPAPA